jgi:capsular polysaccharide export protein
VSDAATINRDLLRAARDEFPKAHIVYKPHPDVATGLRPGTVPEQDLARLADAVVAHADIVDLIAETDRLVTLSSLSGFEALLRGKPVTVHGMPFYAGWGLTDDHTTTPRRTRRRDLESLAAAALIRYCRYVDPVHRRPTTPEAMVAALARQRGDPVHRFKTGVRRQLSWAGRKLGL